LDLDFVPGSGRDSGLKQGPQVVVDGSLLEAQIWNGLVVPWSGMLKMAIQCWVSESQKMRA